jgi:hypothetical protein
MYFLLIQIVYKFSWTLSSLTGMWIGMYMCVRSYRFCLSLYYFSMRFCSDGGIFICFSFYYILLWWRGIYFLSFYYIFLWWRGIYLFFILLDFLWWWGIYLFFILLHLALMAGYLFVFHFITFCSDGGVFICFSFY